MWRKFCKFILVNIWGWTPVGGTAPDKKCILLGVPHTSAWDFVIAYLFYQAVGGDALCMVKKEFFKWPLGPIIRKMGGIPVDRKSPSSVVRSVIREMDKRENFHLAIAPEGTRKPVKKWKTGFHLIAKETGVPVYLCYFDWGTKRVGIDRKVELTDDPKADMERIQKMYEEMHLTGKHPENYITH
ncbi:MAG: 1-acyl-sn-glycerol-3-phosphate acyltransferase [Bacteroidales bacterium]|nr:1-acyl-sn-glycerol-3-phosphate acyltransferase [Bacteroidales bacterium]